MVLRAPERGTEVTAGPAEASRLTLVDAVRGLAIVLVVAGHVSQGMQNRGLWHGSAFALRLDAWMYAFHMPAFFFMAGLFATGSLRKRGLLTFVRDRASALLWPYLLFEIFNMTLYRVSGHFTHAAATSWQSAAWIFFTAASAWFLPTLFFALLVFALCSSGLRSFGLRSFGLRSSALPRFLLHSSGHSNVPLAGRALLWALLIASLFVRAFCLRIPVNFVAAGLYFLPFVTLGAIVGPAVQHVRRVPLWLAAALSACLGWTIWYATGLGWQWQYSGALLLALTGTSMLLLTARVLDGSFAARWAAWVGEASLGVFLLAPYPQVVVRTLLTRLHLTGALLQLTLPTFIATGAGAWIYHHRYRLRLPWLFQFRPGHGYVASGRHKKPDGKREVRR